MMDSHWCTGWRDGCIFWDLIWSDLCVRWRNLPTASCRMSELKNSRHSKRSIVCSKMGSQRNNRRVSGPDRLALSTASTWMGEAKTRAGGKITGSIVKFLPTEVEKFWQMSARCRDSADSRCNFLCSRRFQETSGGIFSLINFVARKSIFAEKRGGEEAANQEIVRVLCIHAQFTADQAVVRHQGVKKQTKKFRQLILYSAEHTFSFRLFKTVLCQCHCSSIHANL